MKRSEHIKQFLDFIDQCKIDYHESIEGMKLEEKRQEDLLHEFENCKSAKERNKLGTQLHKCRERRRKFKDIHEEVSWIVPLASAPENKKTFDKLLSALGNVKRTEERHENWVYIPRIKKGEPLNESKRKS